MLSARDRGLQFGDGLFETCAIRNGHVRLLERHLRRLNDGLARLAIDFRDTDALRQELESLAQKTGEGVLKVIVTRGSSARGYAVPAHARARRIVYLSPLPRTPATLRLGLCRTRLASGGSLAGLKHLNRLEQVLARIEVDAREDIDDGLMLDPEARVIETTNANLFVISDGKLKTPSLARCGVAGVMRAVLLERLRESGAECEEVDITVAELQRADEVFVTNSLIGITPVLALEDRSWGPGAMTRTLQTELQRWLDVAEAR